MGIWNFLSKWTKINVEWVDDHYKLSNINGLKDYKKKREIKDKLISGGYIDGDCLEMPKITKFLPEDISAFEKVASLLQRINLSSKHNDTYYLPNGYSIYYERSNYCFLNIASPNKGQFLSIRFDFITRKIERAVYTIHYSNVTSISFDVINRNEIHPIIHILNDIEVPSLNYRN